jgi:hypothetical protein
MLKEIMTRVRAALLGMDREKYQALVELMRGYRGRNSPHNSLILGGPTSWSWNATLDATHHGALVGPANAHQHSDLSGIGAGDHHAAFTQADHTAIGDAAPHHAQVHGNADHTTAYYPLDGSSALTAPLSMELMDPLNEPGAVAGNEGKLYYLTPGAGVKGVLKQVMKNSAAGFELVQVSIST